MRNALLIAERELRETLRDGRVLAMFLFPLVLYPAMFWGTSQFLVLSRVSDEPITIAVEGSLEAVSHLGSEHVLLVEGGEPRFLAGDVEAWLSVERTSDGWSVDLTIDEALPRTRLEPLWHSFEEWREREHRKVASLYGVDPAPPFEVERGVDGPITLDLGEVLSYFDKLAGIYPALGLMLLVTMAYYPALDSAAERERGTLVTTIVGPVPAGSIVWGKVGTITILAFLSVFAQVGAIALTAGHLMWVVATSLHASTEIVLPSLPRPDHLIGAVLVTLAASGVIATALFLTVLPWRTTQSAESAASVTMTILLAMICAGVLLGDIAFALPAANAIPAWVDAFRGVATTQHIALALAVDFATILLLGFAAQHILNSERFRQ